jgi:putative inorganic carbon (HCO3(-)) transporter
MRDIVVTAVVFGALLLVFRQPYYGIYLWSWLSYMNPHKLCWGFATDMPFALVTAVVTMLAYLTSKEPKRLPWTPVTVLLVMYLAWVTFTTFFALYQEPAWSYWQRVFKIQTMTILTAMLITDRKRLEGLVWVIAGSLAYYGVKGGIFTILKGGMNHVQGPATTFIEGNNEIGLALIMTVPMLRYLQLQAKNKVVRLGLAGAMVLTGVGAIGTQSRGALLAAAVMGSMLWLKSRNKWSTTFYIVAAAGLVAAIMPEQYWERINTIKTYEQDPSAVGRINAWYTAINLATSRITGGGFQAFQPQTFQLYAPEPGNVHDVHSIYFQALGEQGFVGLGMFLLIGLLAWRTGSLVIRACRNDQNRKWAVDLAAMTQVSLIGYATGGAFLGLSYFDYPYHLVVILVLAHQIAVKNSWGTLERPSSVGSDVKPASSKVGAAGRRSRAFPT